MNWEAVDFIKSHEGCKLTAYQDQKGVWTVGWGSTGPDIKEGTVWTQDQADKDLVTRLQKIELQLSLVLTRDVMSQHQLTACTSFIYNLGFSAFKSSTLLKEINSEDDISAAKQFISWDHIGLVENKGLLIRRLQEATLYLQGTK